MDEKPRDPSEPEPGHSSGETDAIPGITRRPGEGTTHALQSASQDFEQVVVHRILRNVGEGGMGVVYEAQQERPICRKMARKRNRLGMDTREMAARANTIRARIGLQPIR